MEDEYQNEAWDCNPLHVHEDLSYDLDLDEEDAESDLQVLLLDRFGDRMVPQDTREPFPYWKREPWS